ncbi:Uncharacterised protein [Klebsiella pneumoniae]|uniref:Uncharacterized protein n=1 Tax=Klebsiella pneumoniae TaxID=573 RepID=A0A8B4VUE9_KLEPN|nr:Uncharacterised protein [Klebsiella pneumoniae]
MIVEITIRIFIDIIKMHQGFLECIDVKNYRIAFFIRVSPFSHIALDMFTEVLPVCAHYLNAICIDFEVVATEHTHQISNITAYIFITFKFV